MEDDGGISADHLDRTTSGEACAICLGRISERAVAVPCNHLTFDFLCLLSWLEEQPTCPLCKSIVTEVQYDFRSPEDWKTYLVPRPREEHPRPTRRLPSSHAAPVATDPALERRRNVYRRRLYARRVGANPISGYRDFTARDFAASPELRSRARAFLRRELQVFSFLDARGREYLIEYISALLRTKELRGAGGEAEDVVRERIGRANARQLLHELEAWLRSPYPRLHQWDEQVQYAPQHGPSDRKG